MEDEKMSRDERKLEAKKLKRQRIEAAGGKRPRPDKPVVTTPQPSKKKKKFSAVIVVVMIWTDYSELQGLKDGIGASEEAILVIRCTFP